VAKEGRWDARADGPDQGPPLRPISGPLWASMSNAASLASIVLLVVPAFAQAADFAPAPTAPGATSLLVWDGTRNRVVAVEATPEQRLWDWDGATWSQRFGVPSPGSQAPFAVAYDTARRVVIAVVAQSGGSTLIREWDGARWTVRQAPWPGTGFMPRATYDTVRHRLVVVLAGNSVGEWDGAQWIVAVPAISPGARLGAALGYDPVHQRTVLYGGVIAQQVCDDCWAWDGAAWTQITAGSPPGARNGASLAFEPTTGRMILVGGDAAPPTTWALQGAQWTQVPTTRDPGLRTNAQFVEDGIGLLLHGGNSEQVGELWRFSANDWHAVADGSPVARNEGAFGWDPVRGQAVLFGGSSLPGQPVAMHFDDTWTYDGRWHRHALAVHPGARSYAAFAWSPVDSALLLFGGLPAISNDTWTWHGNVWVQRTPATSPPPRYGMAMAQDPAGGVLLFGGRDVLGTTIFGDQWSWDGINWQLRTPAAMPSPRAYALATYDPLRNVLVLIGGYGGQYFQQTWEWDGGQWTQRAATPFLHAGQSGRFCFRPDTGRVLFDSYTQWEWDGVSWTANATPGTNEQGPRVATDLQRGRVLRFPLRTELGVLTPTPAAAVRYGNGCAIGPAPGITTFGRPVPGAAAFRVATGTFAPGAATLHAASFAAGSQPLGNGCSLLLGQVLATHFGVAAPSGEASWPLPLPADNSLRGVVLHVQAAIVDPSRALYGGVTISDGLRISLGD